MQIGCPGCGIEYRDIGFDAAVGDEFDVEAFRCPETVGDSLVIEGMQNVELTIDKPLANAGSAVFVETALQVERTDRDAALD